MTGSKGLITTWDQQVRYFRKNKNPNGPRQNFDIDLFKDNEAWMTNDIRILLCLHVNEDVTQGHLNDRATLAGLFNVHASLHDTPLPPTHNNGSKPISAIYASLDLTPSRCGILKHGDGSQLSLIKSWHSIPITCLFVIT